VYAPRFEEIKSEKMSREFDIEMFGDWNPEQQFQLEEAFELMHREVIRIGDRACLPTPPIEKIGLILGVLALNDEVEIIVRFPDAMEQLCKAELFGDFIIVPE